MNRIKFYWLAVILLISTQANADWTLDNERSSLFYVTNKAAAIAEINSFGELSGTIMDNGKATVNVHLNSVDTAIEVRDQRVRDMLFKVGEYLNELAAATVSLDVNAAELESMNAGAYMRASYSTQLSLNGISATLPAEMIVTKLSDESILVQSAKPLIINAAAFGLAGGVEELREVAGLPSINNNAIVSFTLYFSK
jgi:hypothetical protein